MADSKILGELKDILAQDTGRESKARRIAELLRNAGHYRWVGIYHVDTQRGLVSNIAWSGPSAPAYPIFPLTKGLTSRAIADKKTVNVGNVSNDSDYLTALGSTRSEIIVPILDDTGSRVIGTIDVESERWNAFDSAAKSLLEQCALILRGFWTGSR